MFVPGEIQQDAHEHCGPETGERYCVSMENQVESAEVKCADADERKKSIKRLK